MKQAIKDLFDEIWTSVVRTVVPIVVGFILTLALKAGVELDSVAVQGLVQAVFTSLYYIIARAIETYKPKAGLMLGKAKKPTY